MATTRDERLFIDTNVLVYAKLGQAPLHPLALQQLTALQSRSNVKLWISRQIMREYLAVMSRPTLVTPALSVPVLVADVEDFARRFQVADEHEAVSDNLLRLVERKKIGGKQIHDANIVATMQAYGIDQLLTNNV